MASALLLDGKLSVAGVGNSAHLHGNLKTTLATLAPRWQSPIRAGIYQSTKANPKHPWQISIISGNNKSAPADHQLPKMKQICQHLPMVAKSIDKQSTPNPNSHRGSQPAKPETKLPSRQPKQPTLGRLSKTTREAQTCLTRSEHTSPKKNAHPSLPASLTSSTTTRGRKRGGLSMR